MGRVGTINVSNSFYGFLLCFFIIHGHDLQHYLLYMLFEKQSKTKNYSLIHISYNTSKQIKTVKPYVRNTWIELNIVPVPFGICIKFKMNRRNLS